MEFSSRQVNAAIKQSVWPALRATGFAKFTSRNAWRHDDRTNWVVNFQSFNSHLASGLHCTTFSFALNLGVYYLCVDRSPWAARWPDRYLPAGSNPPEYACQARLHMSKQLTQRELARSDVWYVRPDGSNLDEVVHDALRVLQDIGLPWLARFADPRHALSEYLRPRTKGATSHVASLGSLAAAREGSAIAVALSDRESAARLWQAVAENPFYTRFPESQEEAREMLTLIEALPLR